MDDIERLKRDNAQANEQLTVIQSRCSELLTENRAMKMAAASLVALVPLYVSYCGTLLASAKRIELSDRVSTLADVSDRSVSADDFDRILQLVRLCPEHDAHRARVHAIETYYRMLHMSGRAVGGLSPSLAAWTERERANCSHFAAVVLDRCISSSRRLLTREAGDNL